MRSDAIRTLNPTLAPRFHNLCASLPSLWCRQRSTIFPSTILLPSSAVLQINEVHLTEQSSVYDTRYNEYSQPVDERVPGVRSVGLGTVSIHVAELSIETYCRAVRITVRTWEKSEQHVLNRQIAIGLCDDPCLLL